MREKNFKQVMFETVDCFGIDVCLLNVPDLINEIKRCVEQRCQLTMTAIHFHTTNIIQSVPATSDVFNAFDIVVPDGIALTWALYIFGKLNSRDNILRHVESWGPFLYSMAVEKGWSIYLLGGGPGMAAQSSENLMRAFPGIKIVGTRHGYFSIGEQSQDVIHAINQSGASILLVGMGQPQQEEWIIANQRQLNTSVIVGVGGYFDKVSQMANAYPKWVYKYRLFWLYRLVKEPKRLWKRYTIGIMVFGLRVLRVKLALLFSHTNRG